MKKRFFYRVQWGTNPDHWTIEARKVQALDVISELIADNDAIIITVQRKTEDQLSGMEKHILKSNGITFSDEKSGTDAK